jgi:IS5 family transposase
MSLTRLGTLSPGLVKHQSTASKSRRSSDPKTPVHEARTRALQAQGTDEWLATYNARAGIEGTISQAVRGSGLRHSRYRGLPKVHLQNVLTGLALNLTRLGAYFNPTVNPTTRPSRIRELCTAHGLTAA